MRRLLLLMICLAAVFGSGVLAQDEPITLLELLALVPDTAESRTEIYYADSAAIEQAYPPATIPDHFDEIVTTIDTIEPSLSEIGSSMWSTVFFNYTSVSPARRSMAVTRDTMSDIVGFDFFDVQQELIYTTPRSLGVIYVLDTDLQMVRDAYSNLGFTEADNTSAELWCSGEGCENGTDIDPTESLLENPFGGNLGRQQPMVIGDDYLMSAAPLAIVEDHISAANNTIPSLADNTDYVSAVTAAASYGPILQAYFLDGELLTDVQLAMPFEIVLMGSRLSDDGRQDFAREQLALLGDDTASLPPYRLMMYGDTATDREHIALVLLTYDELADAEIAANVLFERIALYTSTVTGERLMDRLGERGVYDIRVDVIETEIGKAVVVLQLPGIKGTPDQLIEAGQPGGFSDIDFMAPGLTYRLLVNSVHQRDTGWLSTVSVEEQRAFLEEIAGN